MNHSIETSRLMRGFLLLTVFLSTCLSASATDYYCDFSVNGIYYKFISGKPDEVAISYDNYETGKYGGNWTNYSGHITVPSTVTYNSVTYKVTAVTGHAFFDCSELQSVSLPNSITSIGYAAFADCPSLSWIELPNNLKEIGTCAFQGCINLRSITVPGSVYSIGAKAFYETAWYDNQPNGLIYAGNVAYQYKGTMPAETQIDIKEGTLGIADQCFYSCSGLTSITIPNSVIRIGSTAFNECNNLTSANLPENITEICSGTFQYCSKLTSIDIPNGVIEIGNHAFNGCSSMTSVSLGNNVTSIKEYAFYHCSGLNSISIPNSVTNIGGSAFAYCSSLSSITIPNAVTSIGGYAFGSCIGLTAVTIPKSVINIGGSAFESCSGLTSISVETGNPFYDSRNNCNAIIETATNTLLVGCMNTIIPNGVTSIGYKAFFNCSSLTSINIPSSVTNIGDYAFAYCSGLTDVYCYAEEIPNTSVYAFNNSDILAMTLHVPEKFMEIYTSTSPWSGFDTIVPIGPYFADANVETICVANWDTDGDGYLSYEEADAVSTLGDVFKGNESITSFDELQYFTGLTSIDDSAFSGCINMTSVSIPKSVTSIGESAFADCINLKDVYCYAEEVPGTASNVFNGLNTFTATLHVPAASAASYWETSPWSDFGRVMSIDMQKIYYAISDESTSLNVSNIESESKARFTHDFNGEWESLYFPFVIDYDVIHDDFELAEIDGIVQNDDNNDGIADITVLSIMGFKGQATEPNTPYLIRAKNAGEQTITFEDITVYPTEEAIFDCSSFSKKYEFTGSYNTLNATDLGNRYTIQSGELVKGATSLAPCRWYMTATARNGAALNLPNKIRVMMVEDVIDGVSSLVEMEEGAIYDLQGRRLNAQQKGINIIRYSNGNTIKVLQK